jgi:hypothetical protein
MMKSLVGAVVAKLLVFLLVLTIRSRKWRKYDKKKQRLVSEWSKLKTIKLWALSAVTALILSKLLP